MEHRRIYAEPGESEPNLLAIVGEADSDLAHEIINTVPDDSGDTRSPWLWVRLANGDLILGCFPQGDLYLETERDVGRP